MRLDRKLNIVATIDRDDGSRVFVHSTPVGRDVFEAYYAVFGKAFSDLYSNDLKWVSGPRVAALLIRDAAEKLGVWDTDGGVRDNLMPEIYRLTNVVMPQKGQGWVTIPFQSAIETGVFSADEVAEVAGKVCFFMLVSAVQPRITIAPVLRLAGGLWVMQTTSLNCTEWAASLTTSASAENSGMAVVS